MTEVRRWRGAWRVVGVWWVWEEGRGRCVWEGGVCVGGGAAAKAVDISAAVALLLYITSST